MYYHPWGRDHIRYQEQQYRATHRSPSPDSDILLQDRKRRFENESDGRVQHGES